MTNKCLRVELRLIVWISIVFMFQFGCSRQTDSISGNSLSDSNSSKQIEKNVNEEVTNKDIDAMKAFLASIFKSIQSDSFSHVTDHVMTEQCVEALFEKTDFKSSKTRDNYKRNLLADCKGLKNAFEKERIYLKEFGKRLGFEWREVKVVSIEPADARFSHELQTVYFEDARIVFEIPKNGDRIAMDFLSGILIDGKWYFGRPWKRALTLM